MAKEEKKVPNLRFKGFTDDWEQHKLGEVCEKTYSGLTGKTKQDFGHGKAKYVTYLNVHDNAIATTKGVDQVEIDPKQNEVVKGDLLFTVSSEVPEEVALNSVWPGTDNNVYLNSFCFGMRPMSKSVNSFFLTYYLRSPQMRRNIYPLAQGISRFNISKRGISSLTINLPNIREQINVYKVIKNIECLITLQQRKLDLLKQLKKGLLQKMFADKDAKHPVLRFNGYSGDWEQRKLGEVAEKVYSGLSGKTKSDFGHGEAAYVTYINVHDNVIAKAKGIEKVEVDSKQNQVQKGDIFFTVSSEVPEEVALNSAWPYETNTRLYLNSFCFGYRSNFKLVNPFFLSYYLRSPHLRQIIFPLAQGISRFNISKKSILQLPIKLPKLQEQKDIYRILQDLENLISLQQQKLTKYQSVKKSLLQQIFI